MEKKFIVELTTEDVRNLFRTELSKLLDQFNTRKEEAVKEDELLTVEQTCEFLHFAKPTVYSYVSQRKIPFIKKGRRLLFSKFCLKEWLKESYMKTEKELKTEANDYILNKKGSILC